MKVHSVQCADIASLSQIRIHLDWTLSVVRLRYLKVEVFTNMNCAFSGGYYRVKSTFVNALIDSVSGNLDYTFAQFMLWSLSYLFY